MVDERGAPASGTVSLIDRETGATRHVEVGIHPTAIVVAGRPRLRRQRHERLDLRDRPRRPARSSRTIPLRWGILRVLGGMPNALALRGETLYVADGGDNALAEVDLAAGKRPRLPPRRLLPHGRRPRRTTARRPSCSTPRGTAR